MTRDAEPLGEFTHARREFWVDLSTDKIQLGVEASVSELRQCLHRGVLAFAWIDSAD